MSDVVEREFHHKPTKVDAIRVSETNKDEVLEWIVNKGYAATILDHWSMKGIIVHVGIDSEDLIFDLARVGDYVVLEKIPHRSRPALSFLCVMSAETFMMLYTMSPDEGYSDSTQGFTDPY